MNNQISNPKTEVPTGIALNEKDYMDNLLSTLKSLEKNYAISLTECSNETLYKKYKNIFDKVSDLQRETFELLFKKGWYLLEESEKQKVQTKFNTLNKEYQDLEI